MQRQRLSARLTAMLLTAALLLTSCGGGTSAATMHLRKTEGTVGVSDGEGKDVSLKKDLGLYSGYQVGTQAESYAWIDLDRVKLAKMDADSEVEIVKEGKLLDIDVKAGSLFFNVAEPLAEDESMSIRTSTMAVGIRGTCGWVTQDTAALLEGTVSVTAGDQEVTVDAGEMAVLTADGTLEVRPFTAASVPAFIREEIAEDEELAADIQDATGMDLTGADPTAAYEELLSTLEDVVYSEIIDFEQDGSPELLVIQVYDNGGYDVFIWQYGHFGPYASIAYSISGGWHDGVSLSLVESNSRPFLRLCMGGDANYCHENYIGSLAQSDGLPEDWGTVDSVEFVSWDDSFGLVGTHNEKGFVVDELVEDSRSAAEDIRAKYTLKRDLIAIKDGIAMTVAEP